jgi:hypothetical protein
MKALRSQGFRVFFGSLVVAALWLMPVSVQAVQVSQFDITSGSISLMLGNTTLVTKNFTENGMIVSGAYQPPPDIFPPLTLGPPPFFDYTLSLRTQGLNPPPSGDASGSTITADFTSLAVGLTGPLIPPNGFVLNIGGYATGTFNMVTNQFTDLSWSHLLDFNDVVSDHSYHEYHDTGMKDKTLVFSFNGTVALVPLPGAALFFLTGLSGMIAAQARRLVA